MSRWEPGAPLRLAQAALDLYTERGFDDTTVAEIAKRAGLTERTFFRHFADKREVLFGGSAILQDLLVRAVDEAPATGAPLDVVAAAIEAVTALFPQERREFARRRQAVIDANAELRARELTKLSSLAAAIDAALRTRGVPPGTARMAAEAGMAVFRVAFERWTGGAARRDLASYLRESFAELRMVAGDATMAAG